MNARTGEQHTVLWELLALCRPRPWLELCLEHGAVVRDADLVVAVVQAYVNSSFEAGLDAVKLLLERARTSTVMDPPGASASRALPSTREL